MPPSPSAQGPVERSDPAPDLEALLTRVARGDQAAYEAVYDRMAGPVYGLIRKVLRDPAQSEEVAQEVLLEVWRMAARFDATRGSAASWVLTIAHRRAIDRVRSETAAAEREQRTAAVGEPALVDEVAETVEASLEAERVRRCLDGLTDLQREAVTLAFYKGYSYPQVAALLGADPDAGLPGGGLVKRDLHALAGAYALNAVDDAERDRFERHLLGCRACADEVRGFAATVTAMGMAAASQPPPGMKHRVMAAAAVTRQLPPAVEGRPARAARRSLAGQRSPWVPRLALGLGAAGLAAAASLGIITITTQHQLDSVQSQNAAIAAVLAAPDARIASAPAATGGTTTVVASAREGTMVFTSSGLRALPSSKVYELWFLGPGNARRAGLVPPASGGSTAPVLASGLEQGDKIGVTVEPAGGTNAPTSTPIVVLTV